MVFCSLCIHYCFHNNYNSPFVHYRFKHMQLNNAPQKSQIPTHLILIYTQMSRLGKFKHNCQILASLSSYDALFSLYALLIGTCKIGVHLHTLLCTLTSVLRKTLGNFVECRIYKKIPRIRHIIWFFSRTITPCWHVFFT